MKIKIGDKIIDANDEPIMLIFENDMQRISVGQHLLNMEDGSHKYCIFPETMDENSVREFMKIK